MDGREARLTVIGGASIDTLVRGGETTRIAGGAGLYTALGAWRAGYEVTMIAPRPAPMPGELAMVAELLDWQGPEVAAGELPHFRIDYDDAGRRNLEILTRGAEAELTPEVVLDGLPDGPVCVIPLTDPELQVEFIRALKAAGRWVACGTYPCGAREQTARVRAAFEVADAFFCNEEEAEVLFGDLDRARTAAGKLLFVTRGRAGARVVQGSHATDLDARATVEVDPTGAGDVFCGAVLAELSRGRHPVQAARIGVVAAAEVVGAPGPAALLGTTSAIALSVDPRVRLDPVRIESVAGVLAGAPSITGFDFCGEEFPEPGDPGTLDFFFAQTLQQFGFWTKADGRYRQPMIAPLGSRMRKGSDYLWAVYRRWLDEAPEELRPAGQANLTREKLDFRYRSDDGDNPVPAAALHWRLARAYGADIEALGTSPAGLLAEANAASRPAAALVRLLDHIGGYKEDPLRKKSSLLALVLRQRPEGFLRAAPDDELPPIVDYHIQRSCLRMGLVEVVDEDLARRLVERRVLPAADERAVREACYRAVSRVQTASGKPMAAVDWFFFQNRRRCPEMSEPDCPACEVESVCAKRKELFQPVLRTTHY